jgi:HSP20 family protein
MLPVKRDLFSDLDTIFEEPFKLLSDPWLSGFGLGKTTGPAMDVVEHDNHYEVTAEVPGFNKDELKISFERHSITVSGKREEKLAGKKALTERSTSFSRSIRLGVNADVEHATAALKDGVISVSVPKSEVKKSNNVITID